MKRINVTLRMMVEGEDEKYRLATLQTPQGTAVNWNAIQILDYTQAGDIAEFVLVPGIQTAEREEAARALQAVIDADTRAHEAGMCPAGNTVGCRRCDALGRDWGRIDAERDILAGWALDDIEEIIVQAKRTYPQYSGEGFTKAYTRAYTARRDA